MAERTGRRSIQKKGKALHDLKSEEFIEGETSVTLLMALGIREPSGELSADQVT